MNLSPEQMAAMQSRYTEQQLGGASLMAGEVPAPQNDQEAVKLVQESKAAIDAAGGISRLTPEMKAHVRAVLDALEQYEQQNPDSPLIQRLMNGIRNDPALAPYL